MPFADAGIEKAIGKIVTQFFELVSGTHGSRQYAHTLIVSHGIMNRRRDDICVGLLRRRRRLHRHDFVVFVTLKGCRSVKLHGILTGRLEPVPLFRQHMQQDRALDVLDEFQVPRQ